MKVLVVLALLSLGVSARPALAGGAESEHRSAPPVVRFATFNASLNRGAAGELIANLSTPGDVQAQAVAEIIQRVRPDVLLVNEFDFDTDGARGGSAAAALFQQNYLGVGQHDAAPIEYRYRRAFPANTGLHVATMIPGGIDLNRDGTIEPAPGSPAYAGDAIGFGFFEGQFAFVVYSRYPILDEQLRTFQKFLWKDMPRARLPVDPVTGRDFYSERALSVLRLSSKNHVDVPIEIGQRVVHFLVSHPTPPVFDGPEDRNGLRNADEIRFWADYITPDAGAYIRDDDGQPGGLPRGASFVIAGDQNADPFEGDSVPGAIQQLLEHPLVNTSVTPASQGGVDRAAAQAQNNADHLGEAAFDTADFGEAAFGGPGNLRVDYVLPQRAMRVVDAGVFWPGDSDPAFRLTGPGYPTVSSDHRLVWIDISLGQAADAP